MVLPSWGRSGCCARAGRLAALLLALLAAARASAEISPDYLMDADPVLTPGDKLLAFPKRLVPLWIEALSRPEADYQRMAAESIARATRFGVPGLPQAAPRLRELVRDQRTAAVVRVACARALVAIDARDATADLVQAARDHTGDVRQLIETALADWSVEALGQTWLDRLSTTGVRHRELLLAVDGLGKLRAAPALERLKALVHAADVSDDLRLAAARSAGQIASQSLESDAARLVAVEGTGATIARLCAARLLARHTSDSARALLLELAVDTEPAVAAAALGHLNELDPELVAPLAERCMRNPDPQVRREGLRSYAARPSPARAAFIVRLLDDVNPPLRAFAREECYRLAQMPEYHDEVCAAALEVLSRESWRGLEQASLLLGALQYKPAASRLVALQTFNRHEVRIPAAWALRKIAVRETLPAILAHVQRITQLRIDHQIDEQGIDEQIAHLIEAMSSMGLVEAEPLWRNHVPKRQELGMYSRSAAIWALGKLLDGRHDEALAAQLIERVTDPAPLPPEMDLVRAAAAVTLGRMNASQTIPQMRRWVGPGLNTGELRTRHGLAIRWAVMKMTGEHLPEPTPVFSGKSGWFLEPFDKPVSQD